MVAHLHSLEILEIMILLLSIPFIFLFTVGAKASIENERGQIDRLLRIYMPKLAIVLLFFVCFPVVIWNGCKWCVWRVKAWLALRRAKRIAKSVFKRIAKNHGDDSEMQSDFNQLKDKINKL